MDFYRKLKEERLKNNFSQEMLAKQLQISRQSVSKWERNEGYPNIETLLQLSEIFNITVDELLKGDDYLKNKIIQDSKSLKHPRLKAFFDIVLVVGLLFIILKLLLFVTSYFFNFNIEFLNNSILYSFGPFLMTIIGAIGSETLKKQYK
ncbi:helix-turn-helix domain-containing protein [Marinococcus halophilus]|uniref:helix-turn-helix domain-containing protein n=1 Tax=Marinococcus halophilus TaxID=1371 RepID=UPI0009A88762|nr:helix-turn-helix transcriptional regulator [Marinococcus halophilus]